MIYTTSFNATKINSLLQYTELYLIICEKFCLLSFTLG